MLITETGDHQSGLVEHFVLGVDAGGHHYRNTGGISCQHTVSRVFDDDAPGRFLAGFLQGQQIYVGCRFLSGHDITCQDMTEADIGEGMSGHGLGGFLSGGGADTDRHSVLVCLLHEPMNPRSELQAAPFYEIYENLRFTFVQADDQFIDPSRIDLRAESPGLKVVLHALLAPRNFEQVSVIIHLPGDGEAKFFEGGVEGNPMPVFFSVDDDPIHIEKKCFRQHHFVLPVN